MTPQTWSPEVPIQPGYYFMHKDAKTRMVEVVPTSGHRGPGKPTVCYWADGAVLYKEDRHSAFWWKVEEPPTRPETVEEGFSKGPF